jgi:diguanylate cyclase (GGDEF)-like protein
MENTILIIEDSPSFAAYLKDNLQDSYRVVIATKCREGIDMARDIIPDLVLLDIVMPDIDGYTACAELKTMERTKDIPVIFVSSLADVVDQRKGLDIGAIDYIVKPVDAEILRAKVRNHIEMRHQFNILENMSLVDPLTGVGNRRLFEERLETELRRSKRAGQSLALFMIDIDFFKQYNDTLGHPEGDKCLFTVATTIKNTMKRAGDIVSRYGGEEFVIIAPDVTPESGKRIAEKIRKKIESLGINHPSSAVSQFVTVSVGVAVSNPNSPADRNTIVKKADDALYQAKNSGRNRCVLTV